MSDLDQQLKAVQATLRKCAQQLGTLNLSNNKFQESNQQLAIDIKKIENKIVKKAQQIEQELSDKHIIHQQLVKAQTLKEELEIRHSKIQTKLQRKKQIQQIQRTQPKPTQPKATQPKATQGKETQEKKKEGEGKNTQMIQLKRESVSQAKTQKKEPISQKDKHTPKPPMQSSRESLKKETPSSSSNVEANYKNTGKGEYQPPALFMDQNDSDSDGEEDNSKMLENMRKKLKEDKQEMDNDDDD